MKFGLMFFASSEEALAGNKYRLVTESARFADENGFSSVWVPERHFTEFGSLYPNPAVLHAALAAATSRIRLNAGSVVTPLHHPVRIAEEWSMVDNLSHGRVGISFAPGWNPDDFAFCPEKYAGRREGMFADIETVRHLWRGGAIDSVSGNGGAMRLRIYPTPVQRELPFWLTAAGNPDTFIRAGEMGANLLTHVLDQDEDQLARKIALYRAARAKNGHDPAAGCVTVMLHTFVGCDAEVVREQARAPFCSYIRGNIGLLNGLAQSRGQKVDVRAMPAHELDQFVLFLYERFAHSRGLIGTPESCLPLVRKLEAMGADEVACLLDFGPPADLILENLPHLLRLRELARPRAAAAARFDPAAVQRRCTERITGSRFNETLRDYGIRIDGAFHLVREIWRRPGEALAKVGLPEESGAAKFALDPAFLDACGRVLAAAIELEPSGSDGFYIPSGVGELKLHGKLCGAEVWSHAVLRKAEARDALIGDVRVYDEAGSPLIEIEALRLHRVDRNERAEDFTGLLYRRVWKPLPETESVVAGERGDWLILADRAGVGERLARRLEASGQTCALMVAGLGDDLRLLGARWWKGVVDLRGLDLAAGDVGGGSQATAGVLKIVQALAAGDALPRPKLWLVTAGAMPVFEGESPAVAQSLLWGLGQAIAAEHPALWGGLIDLDPRDVSEQAIADAILDTRREDLIAVRSGRRHAARIVRDDRTFGLAAPLRFKPDATYVISGGTGGLGRRLAVWLEERGAGHVLLMGRSASGPGAMRCDVSRRAEVAEAFGQIERSMPPVKGIFHLAGVLDDAMLVHQDAERFQRAGAAKIEGAWNLHECSARLALDHFVLFSSMASLVTMPGQGSYASANGFLDVLAHLRRSEGKPSLSVNWGTWAEIGHAATDYGRRAHERLANMGIDALAPDLALAVLGHLMERGVTQSGVARVNWARLFEADPAAATPLLSEFLQPGAPAAVETELLREVRRRRPEERREFVISALAGMLADALRLPDAGAIAPDRSLFDLGLDSILALELTNRISTGFGHPFRATLFFTHPTLAAVADHILHEAAITEEAMPEEGGELSEDELSELIAKEIGRA